MNTCGGCFFFEGGRTLTKKNAAGVAEEFPGGLCFGAPPSADVQGNSNYPTVMEKQRECALWRATTKRKR